jgi:hypothetical protein
MDKLTCPLTKCLITPSTFTSYQSNFIITPFLPTTFLLGVCKHKALSTNFKKHLFLLRFLYEVIHIASTVSTIFVC